MFKTTKAKLIFVIIFSIICVTITTLIVIYERIDITDVEENDSQENIIETSNKEKDVAGINLKGKYNQNDLKIKSRKATKEKVEVSYFEIDGLRNKEIQNKINEEIETTALNYYKEKIKDLSEVVNVTVTVSNTGNFADTLSLALNYWSKIDDDSDNFYQGMTGLNYDLSTGEKIPLEKLFTSDAPIIDILRTSAYHSILYYYSEETLSGDSVVNNYRDIEEDVANFIELYKRGKLTDFYYTTSYICIFYEDYSINIEMEDWADYIAIYSRYLAKEDLYDSNIIGYKNLYTLTDRNKDNYYYSNYQNENNYLIDITLDWNENETSSFEKELVANKIEAIEKEIERVKQLASQNANNFYILNYNIYLNTFVEPEVEEEIIHYYENGNSYEMTVHDFEENVEPIVIATNREASVSGGASAIVYDFGEVLKIEPQQSIEYYTEDGEKIVI